MTIVVAFAEAPVVPVHLDPVSGGLIACPGCCQEIRVLPVKRRGRPPTKTLEEKRASRLAWYQENREAQIVRARVHAIRDVKNPKLCPKCRAPCRNLHGVEVHLGRAHKEA